MADLTQITIELPTDLIEASERLIEAGKADSFNDLMTLALRQQVSILDEKLRNGKTKKRRYCYHNKRNCREYVDVL